MILVQVLNKEQETALLVYVQRSADIYFGVSRRELKKLAFQFTEKLKIACPDGWKKNGEAGKDWFTSFMKRHPELSVWKCEAVSKARMTAFNKESVGQFFVHLSNLLESTQVTANNIWNMDETGVTTVQKTGKIIARRGMKRVGAMTSEERGKLVTIAVTVSAGGNSIPPFFVFPRARMNADLLKYAPMGLDGVAALSGWMQQVHFLKYMQHFQKNARCSKSYPSILILDNHCSHLSVEALDFAYDNGIHMLSLPPHCSHRLQPLDVSIFKPLKTYFNSKVSDWLINHRGQKMKTTNAN